jgi:predicted O-methyltransferase YrrM
MNLFKLIKLFIKTKLAYKPLVETNYARQIVDNIRHPGDPVCTQWQGDLLHQLITKHNLKNCLEIGFATGSSAIYILNALSSCNGTLISIDIPSDPFLTKGKENLEKSGMIDRHTLVLEDSVTALPKMFKEGKMFDLIFIDGWKTFDHMAVEVYFASRMLNKNGYLVFDDTRMPSVQKIITMLLRHYKYREINLFKYNLNWKYRLFQVLTTRNLFHHPERCIQKITSENDLPVTKDWNYFIDF